MCRSENRGSSSTHSAASSCSMMAATIGGVPRAAPMPVRPLSVATRISVASLLTLVSKVGAVTLFLRNRCRHWNRGHFDDFHGSFVPLSFVPISILDGLRGQIAECHTPRYAEAHLFGQPSRPRSKDRENAGTTEIGRTIADGAVGEGCRRSAEPEDGMGQAARKWHHRRCSQ